MRLRLGIVALTCALLAPAPARAGALPQNDAGSGGDAPNVATASFTIAPNAAYDGLVDGQADVEDWYAFPVPAGGTIDARASSSIGCVYLYDSAGTELGSGCATGFAELMHAHATAADAGTYYLRYFYFRPYPHPYRFSLGVNQPAPPPLTYAEVDVEKVAELLPDAPPPPGLPAVSAASQTGEHAVVAVVDTGVNPYHEFFAAPALTAHPSTWLPGFPASATSVSLTLDAADYATASAADEATFAGLSRSSYDPSADTFDAHLYTFPGTRLVGAISFGEYDDPLVTEVDPQPVRDEHGHGTHSAGLAAGANLAAPDGNVLVVAVEVGKGSAEAGIRWAARQPWIDAISVSLASVANAPVTTSPLGDRSGPEWAIRDAELAGTPVFVASGNGFSDTGVPPDHCSTYTSPWTGYAWSTRIGAANASDGNPTWWHCLPVDAVARTNVPSPDYDSLAAASPASGTSAATPNAAGHYAHLLLAGRQAGSAASNAAVRDYLLHSAAPPPFAVTTGDPSVYPYSLASQGYGLVDGAALDDATARLVAGTGPKPRPETTDWFARDTALRRSLWGPGSVTAEREAVPQDDAGSGGDAPDGRPGAVPVAPGVRYTGTLGGTEDHDWYAFDGTAGDVLNVALAGLVVCLDVVDPAGSPQGHTCASAAREDPEGILGAPGGLSVTLGGTGTWYLHVYYVVPQDYAFGFGLNAPPPVV